MIHKWCYYIKLSHFYKTENKTTNMILANAIYWASLFYFFFGSAQCECDSWCDQKTDGILNHVTEKEKKKRKKNKMYINCTFLRSDKWKGSLSHTQVQLNSAQCSPLTMKENFGTYIFHFHDNFFLILHTHDSLLFLQSFPQLLYGTFTMCIHSNQRCAYESGDFLYSNAYIFCFLGLVFFAYAC